MMNYLSIFLAEIKIQLFHRNHKLFAGNPWRAVFLPMVLILDGNSEKGAHVISNLSYFTCLRHSTRFRAVIIGYFTI